LFSHRCGNDYPPVVGNKCIKFSHQPYKWFEKKKGAENRERGSTDFEETFDSISYLPGFLIYQCDFVNRPLPVNECAGLDGIFLVSDPAIFFQ
jgi:hypothetical protein